MVMCALWCMAAAASMLVMLGVLCEVTYQPCLALYNPMVIAFAEHQSPTVLTATPEKHLSQVSVSAFPPANGFLVTAASSTAQYTAQRDIPHTMPHHNPPSAARVRRTGSEHSYVNPRTMMSISLTVLLITMLLWLRNAAGRSTPERCVLLGIFGEGPQGTLDEAGAELEPMQRLEWEEEWEVEAEAGAEAVLWELSGGVA